MDYQNKFSSIANPYFNCIDDEKFMTFGVCIKNTVRILQHDQALQDEMIYALLDI